MKCLNSWAPERRLFETDWENLSNLELLALYLAPGNPNQRAMRQALRLLRALGPIEHLNRLSTVQLRQAGMTRRRAMAFLAGWQLFRRAGFQSLEPGQPFRSSLEIFEHFGRRFELLRKETFWNVLLDGKNRILRMVRISEGSLTSALVHPREVYRPAILEAAAGLLFVHNHPSGDPAPSPEDIQITRRLVETGKIIGIRVLDHVIIGAGRYYSFADQGLL